MSKNVVFVPNIKGKHWKDKVTTSYDLGAKSWEYWCEKNDIIFIEWKEPVLDPAVFPIIYQRDWVFDIQDHNNIDYDQVLIVDADTIVNPDCPNFFNETHNKFGVTINNGCYEWVTRSVRGWGEAMFPNEPLVKTYEYINTGFIIVNKKHKEFLDKVKELYLEKCDEIKSHRDRIKASTGQTIVNFMLKKHKIEVTNLSESFNLQDLFKKNIIVVDKQMQHWMEDRLHFLDCGWVYHFNAIPPNPMSRDVSYWMKRTYEELYK